MSAKGIAAELESEEEEELVDEDPLLLPLLLLKGTRIYAYDQKPWICN
jgi:hypothetical protein